MIDDVECGVSEDELRKLYAALGDNVEARAILWQLEQGARGVRMENDDLYKAIRVQRVLVYREHLVQEVIKLYWEVEEAAEADDPDATFDASRAYDQAIRHLAEWKP